ncbi:hypothetical protein CES85_3863 [Ochrobactrum quorumnocens]|uniref:DUF2147 domain-containing protein n=1 Tax=Ochrobactrum quorumnocens TaxID=271865 RepID=A0A248U8R2_9HYPH|nr:DUF2147 domain-containing protein [[Ochrobactrum] quorumnocens]ASV83088.1 hypothetical protein CES85_3863 [[Ochrobactrum] quorumnocens]KAA9368914.1 DUF2147 domain-containing protein [[Ochrobactrum] quorumnocens]
MKWILTITMMILLFPVSAQATDISGNWARGDGKARVRIAECGKDICATNTWIKPGTAKEKTGDRLVMSINQTADGQYSGTAFDPQRNLTYKISVKVDGDKMTTNGCVLAGLLCRNVGWSRIN